VGGVDTVKVDVRLVSATHRDLERLISEGKFREDLYYRLNVFPITMPPLRERPGDIALLVEHFIAKYAQTTGKAVRGADGAAIALLAAYAWPGNVRELENVVERAMILATSDVLTPADLDFGRRQAVTSGAVAAPVTANQSGGISGESGRSLYKRLSEQERNEIVSAVDQAQGNIAHAARALGINRSTLYYRMRKHGLEHLLPTRDEPTRDEPAAPPAATE
jgi:DNA-binding NtrC family response regulator